MIDVAATLGPLEVLDARGEPVRFETFWRERPAVVVFIRHFGWMFCREQVAQLRDILADIRSRGAELHVIGSGSPKQAAQFAEDQALDFGVYVDPKLSAYEAFGLRRDLGATFTPRILSNVVRAFRGGFRQGRIQGDSWQQGGAFVIAPNGSTWLAYVSQVGGDHVDPQEILRALDEHIER